MNLIRSLFFRNRSFLLIAGIVLVFALAFPFPWLLPFAKGLLFLFIAALVADVILLFRRSKGIQGTRATPDKLSNGDENPINIYIENFYDIPIGVDVIDEIPHQFQRRNVRFTADVAPREVKIIEYHLRPLKRGVYNFGAVNVYAYSPIGLVSRKYRFSQDEDVPVYPSYLQLRKYELLAISNRLMEGGIKKIRKIGHNMEFEQIRDYVVGDDFRTINWKATARKSHLMVNNYQDEKSQQVYSLIDKGRVMKMPFNGLSLLDYAINASLVISNTALKKEDKAGIITFQHKIGSILPASRRNSQMHHILELLYNQKTAYKETDYSVLYSTIKRKITQRSLLLLFTNFESVSAMERQLPYLVRLSKDHLVVAIFFINTELDELLISPARDMQQVYHKIIAEKFTYEKKLIVKQLNSHGIHTILTEPEHLTVNTINKYLELKARGLI